MFTSTANIIKPKAFLEDAPVEDHENVGNEAEDAEKDNLEDRHAGVRDKAEHPRNSGVPDVERPHQFAVIWRQADHLRNVRIGRVAAMNDIPHSRCQ